MAHETPAPAYSQSEEEVANGVQVERDSQFLIDSFLPSATDAAPPTSKLPLPFCLPQVVAGEGTPFARGYSDVLRETVNLSMEEFVAFLDGLNIATAASPPLRVVHMVGVAIAYVPYHWFMIAGIALQVGAKVGMKVISKTLTDRYMRAANLRIFRPRGLAARICTTAGAMTLIGVNPDGVGPKSALHKVGRGVGKVLLKMPLPTAGRLVHAIAGSGSRSGSSPGSSAESLNVAAADAKGWEMHVLVQRRLEALGDAVLPVSMDVPPPAKAKGAMETMQSWGVKFDEGQAKRRERRRVARVQKLAKEQAKKAAMDAGDYSQASVYDRVSHQVSVRREQNQLLVGSLLGPRLLGSSVLGPKPSSLETRVANAELKDRWESDETLWLVIIDAARDREITGIDEAENERNEEVVTEQAWRQEMELEGL
ncbi:uncharacterized protein SCHCODRAFT_02634476 [Schizophyllum commune H4-8]|uniref:Uncharacterized protein n=1 Tax=Schizophyllum commune (strain H4-8 / FGSC 9210) TaxID=578458 RepID=D8QC32_SCHCM|nr:uncharacterized protein SCHCODRAFT_02634476 [Schizophyllum commune H4-8]KAI5889420.1 hypothetical protein SCHCODRAFT_02634476 [Schizophyllum commune H4-8]